MSADSLASLQQFIAEAIRRPTPFEDERVAADASQIFRHGKRGRSALDGLEVYRDQFWLRHLANLTDDFPTLAWVLGPGPFRELMTDYVGKFPPRTWNLQRLGAEVPAYTASTSPWCEQPLAVDAAVLDWAFVEAFDAADASPLDEARLAAIPDDAWLEARVALHPSLRRIALGHPIHDSRASLRRGETPQRPIPTPTNVVIWRDPVCALQAVTVDPIAFDLLGELAAGAGLGQACDSVIRGIGAARAADLQERLGQWFAQWAAGGWIAAVVFNP